jgi:hypothetical protein
LTLSSPSGAPPLARLALAKSQSFFKELNTIPVRSFG